MHLKIWSHTILWFSKPFFLFASSRNQQHNNIEAMQVRQKEFEKEARSFKGFQTQVFYRCSANETTKSNQTNIFRQFIVMRRKWKEMGILALIMKQYQGNSYFQFILEKCCLVDVPPPFKASTLYARQAVVHSEEIRGDHSGFQK